MIMLLKNSLYTTGKITFTKLNYFFYGGLKYLTLPSESLCQLIKTYDNDQKLMIRFSKLRIRNIFDQRVTVVDNTIQTAFDT